MDGEHEVAIKFLNPAEAGTLASRERFEAEIHIMRLCNHANVVSSLGAWSDRVRPSSMVLF